MAQAQDTLTEIASRLRLAITRTARGMRQDAGGDLSPSATSALATIERHGPLTPSELAEIERVKRPTATRILRGLEQQKLIARTRDPEDGRSALVVATPEGTSRLRRMRGRKNAYLARRMRGLEPEELRTLDRAARILERLLEEGKPVSARQHRAS
jgi:DNA-binding MarR family transcriptional regulator